MAFEHRQPRDYLFGTLTTAAALSDTALVSAAFAGLPSNYSGSVYLPMVLHDPSTGVYEVVWVTAHAGGSQTVTAARGREGSSARSWPAGTQVVCAPTIRDGLFWVPTRSALPTDAHVGMRAEIADENAVADKLLSGWNTQGGWTSYSPAWTTSGSQPVLGNGQLTGEYTRVGDWVYVRVGLTIGSTTSAGGAGQGWAFSIPVTSRYVAAHNPYPIWCGGGVLRDVSATKYYGCTSYADSTGGNIGLMFTDTGTVSASTPFLFAVGDFCGLTVAYRAA